MKKLFVLLIAVLVISTYRCKEIESGTGQFVISMTDAPADYDAVFINIVQIEVIVNNNKSFFLDVNKRIDILQLTNGLDTILANADIPVGRVSHVRLILNEEGNSIVLDGDEFTMKTPSEQESGLKLQINADIVEGASYKLLLDFDAAQSIVQTGNGKYVLKPVIRVISNENSGAIKGLVFTDSTLPKALNASVMALSGADTIATAFTDSSGRYLLNGITPGTYDIWIDAESPYGDKKINTVNVFTGAVTDLSGIRMKK